MFKIIKGEDISFLVFSPGRREIYRANKEQRGMIQIKKSQFEGENSFESKSVP